MALPALAIAGIVMSAAQMANSFMSGQASAASQKKMLKLQKKQWELDVSKAYQDSLSTLNQLKTTYRQSGYEVAQTQANIESLDYWLQNYQGYYDFEMAQQQLAVDQQRNNVAGMFYSNIGNLRQMQRGLHNSRSSVRREVRQEALQGFCLLWQGRKSSTLLERT